jgi:predicted nucleic acid-binding protein
MIRIFIDTDVIVDALIERAPHCCDSSKVISLCKIENVELYASVLIFANIFYVASRIVGKAKTRESLKLIRKDVSALSVTQAMVDRALDDELFKDFEDAIQYQCALAHKMDAIVTRNQKDYKYSTIDVFSPEQIINKFKKTK